MNLRKLPPSMLLTLGLACGDGKGSDETTTVNACLSPMDPTAVETTPCLSTTGIGNTSDVDTGPCLDVGPCLSDSTGLGTSSGSGTSSGTGTGTSSGTGTGTGTGSDSGTGSGSGESTFGPCLSPEVAMSSVTGSSSDTDGITGMMADEPSSRAAVLERVLDRGTLPADVAARLRDRLR